MTDVLHALRCVGFAGLERLADAAGRPESELEPELLDLAAAGLVTTEPGPFGGWGITEAGRIEDARRTATELAAAQLQGGLVPGGQVPADHFAGARPGGARAVVAAAYERFLVLNPLLLDLCSAWQLRPVGEGSVPNEHRDRGYDDRVLGRFVELDRRAADVCVELASVLPRFGRYRVRLAAALEQARSGMLEQLTDGTSSYHAVWFQLHEDLLATLGIPRW